MHDLRGGQFFHKRTGIIYIAMALATMSPSLVSGVGQGTSVRVSSAPLSIEYPSGQREWGVRLATYADNAAQRVKQLLDIPLPAGRLVWRNIGPGTTYVSITDDGASRSAVLEQPFPRLAGDFGVGYTLGLARWLSNYAVAKLAISIDGTQPWWVEGAALYITDVVSRQERATTPALYGLEAAFIRSAQRRLAVDIHDAIKTRPSEAARGKAYTTFRLLEAVYGIDAPVQVIGALRAAGQGSAPITTMAAALKGSEFHADMLLRGFLDPASALDIGLDSVDIRDQGSTLRARLTRKGGLSFPVVLEIRCDDETTTVQIAASDQAEQYLEEKLYCQPRELQLDPDGLIPDINRANNRHGFGSGEAIRRLFTFDDAFEIGELQFNGEVTIVDGERREGYTVAITNRTDRHTGVGFLVSAEWLKRPERTQRAFFVPLGPGESRLVSESLAYPRRGTGRALIEARYWQCPDVDTLSGLLIAEEPRLHNAYIVTRTAPSVPRGRSRSSFGLLPSTIRETIGTPQEHSPDDLDAKESDAMAGDEEETLSIRLLSPSRGSVPVGDVTLHASVITGRDKVEQVAFYVNDRRVGAAFTAPYRVQWAYPDQERVFVIRSVVVDIGGNLASDSVVLDRTGLGFGSTVDLVTMHVTVRDRQGRLVRNLTADDFSVRETNVPQNLVQFEYGEIPVATVLLLDTSSSMIGGGIVSERAGASQLIRSLVSGPTSPNMAMVLGFNERLHLYSTLSNDVERLLQAIESTIPDGSTAIFDALASAFRKVSRVRSKRALVVLSDGLDTRSSLAYDDVLEYARQSDVLVYSIGLQLMHEGTEFGDASRAVRLGVEQLRGFADVTGGAAYFPIRLDELEEIYGRIAGELESQYALSYYPTNQVWDGQWREIEVTLPRHPQYIIQVRPGYYGVAPDER